MHHEQRQQRPACAGALRRAHAQNPHGARGVRERRQEYHDAGQGEPREVPQRPRAEHRRDLPRRRSIHPRPQVFPRRVHVGAQEDRHAVLDAGACEEVRGRLDARRLEERRRQVRIRRRLQRARGEAAGQCGRQDQHRVLAGAGVQRGAKREAGSCALQRPQRQSRQPVCRLQGGTRRGRPRGVARAVRDAQP